MGPKRKIAFKLSDYAYRHKAMPFRSTVMRWQVSLEECFLDCLQKNKEENGGVNKCTRLWWHRSVYRCGMWFADKKKSERSRYFGEWLVHRVPYNIRFELA